MRCVQKNEELDLEVKELMLKTQTFRQTPTASLPFGAIIISSYNANKINLTVIFLLEI